MYRAGGDSGYENWTTLDNLKCESNRVDRERDRQCRKQSPKHVTFLDNYDDSDNEFDSGIGSSGNGENPKRPNDFPIEGTTGKVKNLRKQFEGESGSCANENDRPLPRNRPYRGSKTVSYDRKPLSDSSTTSGDWDFLTSLNDFLRKENIIPTEAEGNFSKSTKVSNVQPEPIHLSPKPPKPIRKRTERRDAMKARSMDAGEAIKLIDYSNPPVIAPLKCTQRMSYNINPAFEPPPGNSMNNLSGSLDSIYERLRPPQQYEPNRVNIAQNPNPVFGYCSNLNATPQYYYEPQNPWESMTRPTKANRPFYNYSGSDDCLYEKFNRSSSLPNSIVNMPIGTAGYVYPNPPSSYYSRFGPVKGSLLGLDYEDRLLRLESDKGSLHLQVSVLSDQIDAQTSKIRDLEKLLDDKKNVLESTEDTLQRELLTRSSLETQKLELMTEISSLRLKQAALERENFDLRDRYNGQGGSELTYMGSDARMWDKPPTGSSGHLPRSSSPANFLSNGSGGDVNFVRHRFGSNGDIPTVPSKILLPNRPKTPPANAYRRIDQSQSASFGTIPRRTPSSGFNNGIEPSSSAGITSKGNSLSSGNINSVHCHINNGTTKANSPVSYQLQLKPLVPQSYFSGLQEISAGEGLPSASTALMGAGELYYAIDPTTGTRSTSAPNLAATEQENWDKRNKPKSPGGHKSRGILRIFSKIRRSNSGGLDNDVAPETVGNAFVRGGFRSTAAPRLGWARDPSPLKRPEGPVSTWDADGVIAWLSLLGLGIYAAEVKRWVKTGQQLLDATSKELEKELGVKNQLHRKKLNLALAHLKNPNDEDHAGKLDYHWVIRWLDDIGLPQYKESFGEARIDGRMLNNLTSEDLTLLRVTNFLHHISIKRGIQLLRIHNFNPNCLCRRGPGNSSSGIGMVMLTNVANSQGPKHVATWTNHRVMEWLRAIDLAEYAPNLRGSGVHGALIILEPKFNAELLATLLSIPANKTLLRRHLSLQVNELVGRQIVQEKRTVELAEDFIPISPTSKVKVSKPGVFHLRRKRLSSDFTDELLCPLEMNVFPYKSESLGNLLQGKETSIDVVSSNGNEPSNTDI